jgi:MFS family permease
MSRLFQSYFAGLTRTIGIVSLAVFITRLGGFFTLFLTLILADRGYAPREITIALVATAVAGMAGAGISGWLVGRFGLRGTLLLSSSVTACCAYGSAAVKGLAATVLVSAVLSAGVQAVGPVAQTVVGIEAPPQRRVAMFAVYRLALNLGALAGPLLGTLLMERSMTALLVGNGMAATGATLLLLALPSRLGDTIRRADAGSRPSRADVDDDSPVQPGRRSPATRVDPPFLAACLLFGLVSLVYAQQTGALALGIRDAGHDSRVYGGLLTLNAIAVILFEIPLSRFSGRWQRRTAIALGAVCVCGGYAVYALGFGLAVLVLGVLLWTLGEILLAPVAAAFASESAPPGAEPKYQSLLGLCQSAGMAIGPAAGVYAYSYAHTLPWQLCAVALLVTASGLFQLIPRAAARRPHHRRAAPRATHPTPTVEETS